MKKKLLSIVLAAVMVLSLAACGSKAEEPAAETPAAEEEAAEETAEPSGESYTIKIGSAYADGHYMVECYKAFEEYVEAESDGRIQVEIFANASLVSGDSDGLELLSSNSVQMANSDYTMIGTFVNDKRWESTSIPFYYGTDPAYCYKILDNAECWQELYKELETAANIKILGSVNGGSACVSNATISIEGLEDFKGLRLRTPESKPYTEPIAAWGGNPTPMAFGEIYTSIQQNVIDGVFTSKSAIVQYKFTELCKYHTDIDAFLLIFGFGINNDFYNSMDAEAQKIVDEGAAIMVENARAGEVEFRASLDTTMEEAGVTVIKPDDAFKAALADAVAPYVEERKAEIPEFMEALDAAIAEIQ